MEKGETLGRKRKGEEDKAGRCIGLKTGRRQAEEGREGGMEQGKA